MKPFILLICFALIAAERPRFSELAKLPPTAKSLQILEGHFAQSAAFVRGEIDDPKNLEAVIKYAELSKENQKVSVKIKKYVEAQESLSKWFQMAADLAYEESTLQGLYASQKIRAVFLSQMEVWADVKTDKEWLAKLGRWLDLASVPWPVDRVVVGEGKRLANPALFPLVDTAARLLQKNPYQSLEKVIKGKPGAQSQDAARLKEIWQDKDVSAMREELSRISRLKLKLAAAVYQIKYGKPPQTGQDLVSDKLMRSLPIDYQTGRPMEL